MQAGQSGGADLIPCPRCGEPAPRANTFCSLCGGRVYAQCPECRTPRAAGAVFCAKCGFDFTADTGTGRTEAVGASSRLRLRKDVQGVNPSPDKPTAPSYPVIPPAQVRPPPKPKRVVSGFRTLISLVMVLFIIVVAAWGAMMIFIPECRRMSWALLPALPLRWSSNAATPEPDWEARYQYWYEVSREQLPGLPTNIQVEIRTVSGAVERGLLVAITENAVRIRRGQNEIEFPRQVLDTPTQQKLFQHNAAAARAREKVAAERTEWQQQQGPVTNALAQHFGCAPPAVETAPPPPAPPQPSVASNKLPAVIKCPLCKGEGFYMVKAKKGFNEREPCSVCAGQGYRNLKTLSWPKDAVICPDCQGMGMRWVTGGRSLVTTLPCERCGHRGYIVNKFQIAQ